MTNKHRRAFTLTLVSLFAIITLLIINKSQAPPAGQKPLGESNSLATSSTISKGKPKEGEEIGQADQPGSGLPQVPPISRANVLISVVDEQGQTVEEGAIEIMVEYQDFPDRNYAYSVDLGSLQGGLLPLAPPPSHLPATMSIRVVTPAGEVSDTLAIKNDKFWDAVSDTERYFIAGHEFVLE